MMTTAVQPAHRAMRSRFSSLLPLAPAEFKAIAQVAVALWVATSLFWAVPDLLSDGRIPLRVLIAMLFDVVLGLVLCGLFLVATLRIREQSMLVRRAGVILLGAALAVAHACIDAEVMVRLEAASGFPAHTISKIIGTILIDYMLIYALFATAVSLLLSQFELRQRDQRLAAAESTAQRAQLAALRHQLNPHFMFNTLNAIGSLVATGRGTVAEEMIDRLSDFMRAALGSDAGPFQDLDEELAITQTYLEIEAVRFGDRLAVNVQHDPALGNVMVPSFLLQPLVENALKHAVAPSLTPVSISVRTERVEDGLVVTVADALSGNRRADVAPARGTGTGLKNLRERLALLYGDAALLSTERGAAGFTAIVRLPLRCGGVELAA